MDFSDISPETYNKNTFGKCIRRQREEKALSLRKVALAIGVSAAYLSDIEKGNRYAPISKNNLVIINKLLKVLDIPEDQKEFVIDMAYATHGCHKDIVDYLSEEEKARKFMRNAIEAQLSDTDWDELIEQLNAKTNRKILTDHNN